MSNTRALLAPDVVGPGEARHIIARESPRGTLSRQAFTAHLERPEFPPAAVLASGSVWERRAIVAYARQRYSGRPYLQALELYRMIGTEYPEETVHGRLMLTATGLSSEKSISITTVRRYLQQLGEI